MKLGDLVQISIGRCDGEQGAVRIGENVLFRVRPRMADRTLSGLALSESHFIRHRPAGDFVVTLCRSRTLHLDDTGAKSFSVSSP
jgi:hypothetical protein